MFALGVLCDSEMRPLGGREGGGKVISFAEVGVVLLYPAVHIVDTSPASGKE